MRFKVGDLVFHPAHGIGRIAKVEEKRLLGEKARLYYEVITQKSTVWVPVDLRDPAGLRPLISRRELARCRSLLKSRPTTLNKDHRKRQVELADILKQGSFQVVCELVRDLTAHSWRRPLTEADAATLRKARDYLSQEWAAANSISVEEASREIDTLLNQTKQTYLRQ